MASVSMMVLPALIGHIVLWVCAWNYLNGSGRSRLAVRWLSRFCFAACGILPLVVTATLLNDHQPWSGAVIVYFAFCFTVAIVTLPWEHVRRRRAARNNHVRSESSRIHRFPEEQRRSADNATGSRRLMLGASLNQTFDIDESERELEIPGLPAALDGFSIAHISDLHFTGDVPPSWFSSAVTIVNKMHADIVAVTGDLVDNPECNKWLAGTVGRLRGRRGVYFILGNHDGKQDPAELRQLISDFGFCDLAGKWTRIIHNQHELILAGDEAPWGPSMPGDLPADVGANATRILLAHSPDSIDRARSAGFDLMLAGHTHGGQFCVPGFGAVVCPMQKSLDYASGTIYCDPTVLHVSRGLSGELPLRINCRPEVTRLVLRSPVTKTSQPAESSVLRRPEIKRRNAAEPATC